MVLCYDEFVGYNSALADFKSNGIIKSSKSLQQFSIKWTRNFSTIPIPTNSSVTEFKTNSNSFAITHS